MKAEKVNYKNKADSSDSDEPVQKKKSTKEFLKAQAPAKKISSEPVMDLLNFDAQPAAAQANDGFGDMLSGGAPAPKDDGFGNFESSTNQTTVNMGGTASNPNNMNQ